MKKLIMLYEHLRLLCRCKINGHLPKYINDSDDIDVSDFIQKYTKWESFEGEADEMECFDYRYQVLVEIFEGFLKTEYSEYYELANDCFQIIDTRLHRGYDRAITKHLEGLYQDLFENIEFNIYNLLFKVCSMWSICCFS